MTHFCTVSCNAFIARLQGVFSFILSVLLAGLCISVQAQSLDDGLYREAGRPFIQNFDARTYGGHQQNWAMLQDERGMIYIGNLPVVLEYDGVNWRSIDTPNQSVVRSLAMDAAGTIYVGAHAEFGYMAPDSTGLMQYQSLLPHVKPEDQTFTNVWKVHATPQGVYFRTSTHLFRWSEGNMQVWKPSTEFHRSFWVNDTFYIRAWDVGLLQLEGDSLVMAPGGERFTDERIDVMLPFDGGEILLGTRTGGLFLFDGGDLAPFSTEANRYLSENQLYDALVLSDGTLALATLRGGLVHIDREGRLLHIVDEDAGLQDNTVWSVGTDREGGLWLTLNKGLARVELPSSITTFSEGREIEGSVEALTLHQGSLLAATTLGVYRMTPASDTGPSPHFDLLPGIEVQSWSLLSTGDVLLAATSNGVYQIEAGRTTRLMDAISFYLYPSSFDPNRIYVGLGDGVGLLAQTGNRWTYAGRLYGLTEEVRTIAEDEEGNLWLGSQFNGVMQVKASGPGIFPAPGDTTMQIVRYDESYDLPAGEVKVDVINGQVVFDTQRGMLTYNTQDQVFEDESKISMAFPDTLLTVQRAKGDVDGRLWVVRTGNGRREFSILTPEENGSYSVTSTPLQRVVDFGPFWVMYPDPRDSDILWLGGDGGIVRFDAAVHEERSAPLSAWIRRVSVGRDSLIFGGARSGGKEVAPQEFSKGALADNGTLRFEFAASGYDAPEAIRFQYMLEGFDKDWSSWTEEWVKEYTNLPAGGYRFRVRASNIYRQVSPEDFYDFTMLPPWYLTWWAYLLYLVPLFLGLFAVDRFQRSRLIKSVRLKAEVERAKLKMEAAELQARTLEAENDLLNSELRFLSVVESANDAVISANEKGEIIFWNNQATKIFGYTREEILGKPLTVLMPAWLRGLHDRGLQRYLDTGKPRAIGSVLEMHGLRKDGTEFPLELSLSSWKTDEGIFFSGLLRDITDRKQAEAELLQVQSQLVHSEKMASLGKLTAGIAHEIRNPLNFVNNFASLMLDLIEEVRHTIQENPDKSVAEVEATLAETLEEIKYNAVAIDKHGKRADGIIQSMMDHVRNRAGNRQDTDLNELLDDTIHLTYQGWHAKNPDFEIAIERAFDESIRDIELAPQEMGRVFLNLLENAFDALYEKAASEEAGFNPVISVSTVRRNEHIEIRISDNGPGISPAIRDHIFEPFFTTKPAGSGTGLGLSLSYDIVTNGHGGTIELDRTTAEGTAFIITLPGSKSTH